MDKPIDYDRCQLIINALAVNTVKAIEVEGQQKLITISTVEGKNRDLMVEELMVELGIKQEQHKSKIITL